MQVVVTVTRILSFSADVSIELRSAKKTIYLVGAANHQITGLKLPSNRQILVVLFFNIREVKLTVSESANLVIRECIIFWEKAKIQTKSSPNCVKKLVDLHHVWQELQKNSTKSQDIHRRRSEKFQMDLDNSFDIAHADALERMKIEEDKIFLHRQREPGRPGCLVGVDKKNAEKEERSRQHKVEDEKEKKLHLLLRHRMSYHIKNWMSVFLALMKSLCQRLQTLEQLTRPGKSGRKDFVSPKLVAALDRCQLSIRDSVYIFQATVEAL